MTNWFDSPVYWYIIGFGGQLAFGARFVVQWLASERKKQVVIPGVFWVLSLAGGVALLIYAVHKRDPVFAIGQGLGLVVYARNLVLHRRAPPRD